MADPFVVVGGDAAGLSAASKLKREDSDREVIVFEQGNWVSYAHCGMPYYVKGDVGSLTDLLSLSPDDIDDRGIDLRRQHEVIAVEPADKTVLVQNETDRFEQSYDDLLIATGAHAVSASIDTGYSGVFTMHSMDAAAALRTYLTPADGVRPPDNDSVDTDRLEQYASMNPPESVAIVGGGYVGIEMAEAFGAHDLDIHLFQRSDRLLRPFGEAVGEQVAATLRENDVTLHLGTEVDELIGDGHVEAVAGDDGQIAVDLVLIGIGIRPNTELIAETDIARGESGAIATDEYGRTNREHVYAAGDCAEMRHTVTGAPEWVPLGLTANRAGRAVGQTVAGKPTPVGSVAGTAVVKAFELECGRTGLIDHERATDAGFDPVSDTITASSRSGYYPGGSETTVTLTADRETNRLLGGSIVGADRAAIRIDTLATALDCAMTLPELERLDLAYAPPFSPVWDPILVAAKVLNGTLSEF
ncbi:FAD-dependent oxidoreductase [Halocatena marina]|uniref:FAD-dependent oxidoreductase n=1 Tax=Halocatena marina TaxID=2934937 RepID=UPI003615A7A6